MLNEGRASVYGTTTVSALSRLLASSQTFSTAKDRQSFADPDTEIEWMNDKLVLASMERSRCGLVWPIPDGVELGMENAE